MSEPIHIDGSYGEGGGQIIRTSLSLAALTGRAVEIHNVRARRTKPGLQPQHLAAVRAAAALCDALLEGDSVGSTRFIFEPQAKIEPGEYSFEIGTAGAAPLVVQTVLVPLALSGGSSTVHVTGGTHVPHAPTADYLKAIYLPVLQEIGINAKLEYPTAGYYSRGGGQIEIEISPAANFAPLQLSERGQLKELQATVVTSNLPDHVAERGADTIQRAMKGIGRKINVEGCQKESLGPGASVLIAARCQEGWAGFSSIGELRKPMEKVAEAPCREYLRWWKSGAACDQHLADQLVLPLALARGQSRWTTPVVTEHLRTVLWVVQHFLPVQATIEEKEDGTAVVELTGVAWSI